VTTAAKVLLLIAAVAGTLGLVLLALGAAGVKLPLGRLPGDLTWRRGGTRVSFPLATSLLVSVVATVVLNVVFRLVAKR
jgi:hypothetical protein